MARRILGQLKLQAGDTSGAIAHLEAARALEPTSPSVRYHLARAYQRAGRGDEAKRERAEFSRLEGIQQRKRGGANTLGEEPAEDTARELAPLRRAAGVQKKPTATEAAVGRCWDIGRYCFRTGSVTRSGSAARRSRRLSSGAPAGCIVADRGGAPEIVARHVAVRYSPHRRVRQVEDLRPELDPLAGPADGEAAEDREVDVPVPWSAELVPAGVAQPAPCGWLNGAGSK